MLFMSFKESLAIDSFVTQVGGRIKKQLINTTNWGENQTAMTASSWLKLTHTVCRVSINVKSFFTL